MSSFRRGLIMTSLCASGGIIYLLPFLREVYYVPLQKTLHLNSTQLGVLMTVFGTTALVTYFPGGWLADRFSPRKLMTISLLLTGLAGFYFATFPSYQVSIFIHAFWGVSITLTFWLRKIRFSFAQWYGKSKRRAAKHGFPYVDPNLDEKRQAARWLVEIARAWGLSLFACSQDFLTEVSGVRPSSCIDGRFLRATHPAVKPVSMRKDRTQRGDCRCTESLDIGSYAQSCPHSCIYCYANPRI